MAMSVNELDAIIRQAFPDSDLEIIDLAGDGDHYELRLKSPKFVGISRVQQHKMVYDALDGRMGGQLHALAIKTAPKE